MDPASAIVGLSASLATLSGLVLESVKVLYKAREHFKDAHQEIGRLCYRLKEFDGLLKEFQSQLYVAPGAHTSAVQALAIASVQQMEEDLKDLHTRVRQLHVVLDSSTTKRKLLALRLRHVFTESRVTHYQQLISTHSGALTLLVALNSNHKLDQLSRRHQPALPLNLQRPKHPSRKNRIPTEHSTNKRSYILQLPFGITAASTTTTHTKSGCADERRSSDVYRLMFVPPQWLSDLILQWNFKIERNAGSFPLLGLSLNPIRYNTDPRLAAAVKTCDAIQIRQLLRLGLARADDHIIIRKRPMQLLEAIAPRSTACNPEQVLGTYQCLVSSNAYKNNPSLTQSHAQILISLAKSSNSLLKSALDSFCSHGGSMFWYEAVSGNSSVESASTILSLISRHGAGFDCLEEFLFRQSEPWTSEDLSSIDRWLLGTLAAVAPSFGRSLESYLRSYRSVFLPDKHECSPMELFDLPRIVSEVTSAPNKYRIEFLKVLAKWGTKEMLEPFFCAGLIDLEESAANEMFSWLRLSYLSKAARWGNVDTFEYLLSLGACPIRGLAYLSRFPNAMPQATKGVQDKTASMILKMTDMALSVDIGPLIGSGGTLGHDLLLAILLRTSHLRAYSSLVTDQLVKRLTNDNIHVITSSSEAPLDNYILCAIILDLPVTLKLFVQAVMERKKNQGSISSTFDPFDPISATFGERSVSIKARPPLNSFSWVSLAVELARPECLRVLLNLDNCSYPKDPASAHACATRDSLIERSAELIHSVESLRAAVRIPLQQQDYPRTAVVISTWPCQIPPRLVEEREDQEISVTLREYGGKCEDTLGINDIENTEMCRDPKPLCEDFQVPKRRMAPKLARRARALVASTLASVIQILRLQVWEITVLCVLYIVTLAFFVGYS